MCDHQKSRWISCTDHVSCRHVQTNSEECRHDDNSENLFIIRNWEKSVQVKTLMISTLSFYYVLYQISTYAHFDLRLIFAINDERSDADNLRVKRQFTCAGKVSYKLHIVDSCLSANSDGEVILSQYSCDVKSYSVDIRQISELISDATLWTVQWKCMNSVRISRPGSMCFRSFVRSSLIFIESVST